MSIVNGQFGFNQKVITPVGIGLVIGVAEAHDGIIQRYRVQIGKGDCVDRAGKFDQSRWLELCPTNGPCFSREFNTNELVAVVDEGDGGVSLSRKGL